MHKTFYVDLAIDGLVIAPDIACECYLTIERGEVVAHDVCVWGRRLNVKKYESADVPDYLAEVVQAGVDEVIADMTGEEINELRRGIKTYAREMAAAE